MTGASADGTLGGTIISVRELVCAYGSEVVLKDVAFDVRRGEVFVVIGRSGCGKSTLLKHMIGLLAPVGGSIVLNGRDIVTARGAERLEILKGIGVMYQMGALFGSMSVLRNVGLPLEEYTDLPQEAVDAIARVKLSLVGLERFGHFMPTELSGGMVKRAAIARAMALDPPILFLDEPSAGLDPVTSAGLDGLIRSLAETLGITFVIVSHEVPSILSIADRVILMDDGVKGIAAAGDPRELNATSTKPEVRRFFDREVAPRGAHLPAAQPITLEGARP
ncbi:ABC transporter ATP-binding protein [Humidesulfovibrio sp.]